MLTLAAMPTTEPGATALLLTTWGILLLVSVVFGRVSQRSGLPVALLFILVGILAGSEGIGGIAVRRLSPSPFASAPSPWRSSSSTAGSIRRWTRCRRYWAPAGVLATVGVVVTALLVAVAANAMGLDWPAAMILGAVVSSTDAAAVFSVLRGSGLHLKRRVGVTLELESGLNDPVAVILTTALTANIWAEERVSWIEVGGESRSSSWWAP